MTPILGEFFFGKMTPINGWREYYVKGSFGITTVLKYNGFEFVVSQTTLSLTKFIEKSIKYY